MGFSTGGAGILTSILLLEVLLSSAYKPGGFISIDCGSSGKEYIDPRTNLTWEGDGLYMLGGVSGAIPNVTYVEGSENSQALVNFRYFPVKRQKYCYELPLTSNNSTFLLRAMFLHGGSPHLSRFTKFSLYVNITMWTEVSMGDSSDEDNSHEYSYSPTATTVEGIFYNPGAFVVNLCLVPVVGIPFISSLELRELDNEGVLYSENLSDQKWGQRLYLALVYRGRIVLNSSALTPPLRYPDDQLDRIWESGDGPDGFLLEPASNLELDLGTVNRLPQQAMEVGLPLKESPSPLYPNLAFFYRTICAVFYFHSNYSSETSPVRAGIQLEEDEAPSIYEIKSTFAAESSYSSAEAGTIWSMEVFSPSNLPLDLLAWEVFKQGSFDTSMANLAANTFAHSLGRSCNFSYWQGDPCQPRPYEELTCFLVLYPGYENPEFRFYDIESLHLSHLSNPKCLLFPQTSKCPGYCGYPRTLSITHSDINDDILFTLFENGYVRPYAAMNLSHNQIDDFWNSSRWHGSPCFTWLDLSYNHISKAPLLNELSSIVACPDSQLHGFSYILNVSNNAMRGEFPFDFLFNHSNLTLINADNNFLSGSLNLTMWHQELQQSSQTSKSSTHQQIVIYGRLFSFINNSITSIIPDIGDEMENGWNESLLINNFNKHGGGILLYGNPYCKMAKTKFHKYLCRNSTSDRSYENSLHKKNKVLYYVGFGAGIPGGVLLLLGIGITTTYAIKLQKEVKRKQEDVELLENFQQELLSRCAELLNRSAQPPIFSYQDLRIATTDFDAVNLLGKGSFGEVYKGVFPDKTAVAVKKLFAKQELKDKLLNDFLNEVVLLTGIKHRNLVQLLGCCLNNMDRKMECILVYEFVDQGDLATALWGDRKTEIYLNWQQRLNICHGVARGLSYLHEELQPCIIHRDVKALNVLLDQNFNPKIADFGLVKSIRENHTQAIFTTVIGTRGYNAPEYVWNRVLTEKADAYSFGILILEILSGRKCIDSNQPQDMVYIKDWAEDLQNQGNLLELLDPELRGMCSEEQATKVIEIALLCLVMEHKLRPSMSQVVTWLAPEVTRAALSFDVLKGKATAIRGEGQNRMMDLEAESDGHHSHEEDASTSSRVMQAEARSEEEALVPSGQLDASDSYAFPAEQEIVPEDNNHGKSKAKLMKMWRKLTY